MLIFLHMFFQVLFGQGDALLPYAEQIISFLKSCVHLKCKSAASYAANVGTCISLYVFYIIIYTCMYSFTMYSIIYIPNSGHSLA